MNQFTPYIIGILALFVLVPQAQAQQTNTTQLNKLIGMENVTQDLNQDNMNVLSGHIIQLEKEIQLMQVQLSNLQQLIGELMGTNPGVLH